MTKKKRELIEILLDNVNPEDWPEHLPYATQDKCSLDVYVYSGIPDITSTYNGRWASGSLDCEFIKTVDFICKHWNKTIVHRDEFMKRWNERNPVVDSEGWITWNGGEMPVEKGTLIDVKYRCGIINEHVKAGEITSGGSIPTRFAIDFKHDNNPGDIVAYRIHSKTNTTTPPAQQNERTEETKPIQQEVKASDTQIGGDHYTKLAIQPMRYSMENGLDALQHTVIKYVTRFRDKAGIEDLEKAKHCIDMLIEFERGKK